MGMLRNTHGESYLLPRGGIRWRMSRPASESTGGSQTLSLVMSELAFTVEQHNPDYGSFWNDWPYSSRSGKSCSNYGHCFADLLGVSMCRSVRSYLLVPVIQIVHRCLYGAFNKTPIVVLLLSHFLMALIRSLAPYSVILGMLNSS